MSLKDDIEAIRVYLNVPWCKLTKPQEVLAEAKQALSRIEAALALDDGPPKEGIGYDELFLEFRKCHHKAVELDAGQEAIMARHLTDNCIVFRRSAAELKRRIKEAGK